MASIRYIGMTQKGKCYEIQVSRGYGLSQYTKRWYPEPGWSDTYAKQQLNKAAAKFEADCQAGKVKTRKEKQTKLAGISVSKSSITFEEYATRAYMKALSITASEYTLSNYRQLLRTRLVPTFGEKPIVEITPAEISDFLLSIQADGLSTSTAIKYYGFLSAMFNMAYRTDVILKNPMDKVERPKNTKAEGNDKTVEAFTVEEVTKIREKLDEVPIYWKAYVLLMLDTGMRRGECSGLTWDNVDFKNSKITVCKSLNYTQDKGVYIDTPKNGASRTFDVDEDIMSLLKTIKDLQDTTVQSEYVFAQGCSAEPMHPTSPTHFMKKFGQKYGFNNMHPHKLRHTWASIAITNGADVESVSEKLGHHDAGFTLKQYTHANEESIKKAGDVFRKAVKQ